MIRLYLVLFFVVTNIYATNSVNDDLLSLNHEIKKISLDLKNKKNQRNQLKDAIANSDKAILSSNQILNQLKAKQDITHSQLLQISQELSEINKTIDDLEQEIKLYTREVYQQIQVLNHQETSLLSTNDDMDRERKTKYLLELLKSEYDEYSKLSNRLQKLRDTNQYLSRQIVIINNKRNQNEEKINVLTKQKEYKQLQANALNNEIVNEDRELKILKQQRVELNKLLTNLNNTKSTKKVSRVLKVTNQVANYNEPFFERRLAKPLNAKIIRQYGVSYQGLKSNGVLYSADDKPVFAISIGEVLYNSTVPGYGNVIVINHGDNYISVYGGIRPKNLSVGDSVYMGQVIANSGDEDNQPMGGVYFELRHFGKPVNPSLLVNAN